MYWTDRTSVPFWDTNKSININNLKFFRARVLAELLQQLVYGGFMKTFITFILIFAPLTFALADSPDRNVTNTVDPTCVFESGETGKLKFKGSTRDEAFERTAKACLKARVAFYVQSRGTAPTTERQILFAEDCVNKTFCKR